MLDIIAYPALSWVQSTWIVAFLTLALGASGLALLKRRRRHPLPPGPKGWPLIGNILQFPSDEPWKVYREWGEQYGDLVYLEAFGQSLLVLNSLPIINAVLSGRAQNYSHRRYSPIVKLMNFSWSLSTINYGQRWRDLRRIFHQFLNPNKVQQFRPVIEQELPLFLQRLVDDPAQFRHWLHMYFGAVIMRVSYGSEDRAYNDGLIQRADLVVQAMIKSLQPGKMLITFFSPLQHVPSWFPGAGWKRELYRIAGMNADLRERPFRDTEERMAKGITSRNIVNMAGELINDLPEAGDPRRSQHESLARDATAIAYLAGADTTLSSALALFLALAMYPDVQKRAQAQIDAVIGSDRVPGFSDLDRLPYVRAIVKEVGRWHSATPLALPHVTEKEDIYNGYCIPAKTTVFANAWAVMHDPDIFENPMEFMPERYLDKDGEIDTSVLDPEAAAFGFGRRICPGRHLSTESLSLLIANILALFDIGPALDKEGQVVPLSLSVTPTLISTPLPFQCRIKPRSLRQLALIKASQDT